MKHYILSFFLAATFFNTTSYAMSHELGFALFAAMLRDNPGLLNDSDDEAEAKEVCGICQGDGVLEIEWPSRLGQKVHRQCVKQIEFCEQPVLEILQKYFPKDAQTDTECLEEPIKVKGYQKYRQAFNNAWQDACGHVSLQQFCNEHGEKALTALAVARAANDLMVFCVHSLYKKVIKCVTLEEEKNRSYPTRDAYKCAEKKIKKLEEQKISICKLAGELKELHDSAIYEITREKISIKPLGNVKQQ